MLTEVLSIFPPSIVVSVVLGALLASVVAVAYPPPLRLFPRILLAGIVGSIAGQMVANQLNVWDPRLGDAHLVAIGAGSLLVSFVVRRFGA